MNIVKGFGGELLKTCFEAGVIKKVLQFEGLPFIPLSHKSSSQAYLHYTTIMLSFTLLLGLRFECILLRVSPHLISALSTSTRVQPTALLRMLSPQLSREYIGQYRKL